MEPRLKAIELVDEMYNHFEDSDSIAYNTAKECALIAVDEILKAHLFNEEENHYYFEVKQEIEKL